jgi:hypothetical protein
MTINRIEHFQEKIARAKAGVESGFPSENATTQKCRSAMHVLLVGRGPWFKPRRQHEK